MANEISGLFETLVAASSAAAGHLRFSNAFLDVIYSEFKPVHQTPGPAVTLNVQIPTVSEGDVTDIGSGPLQPSDTDHDSVSIPFDKHPSTSFVIKTWDDIRTPEDLQRKYVQPRLESLMRKCNRYLAELITPTNFATYALVSGSGADTFARADFAAAWKNLAGRGVPVEDAGNLFLVTTPLAYSGMLSDTNFLQAYIVGQAAALDAQQQAKLQDIYGASIRYDQHIARYNAGKEPAIFGHRHAIAAVTALMPPSGSPSVQETTVFPRPWLPVQVQMEYSLKDQGWLIHLHCGLGVKVVRGDFASLAETA